MKTNRSMNYTTILPILILLVHCVCAKPLEVIQVPTQGEEETQGVPVCVTELQGRIEGCLERYERVLVTYQAEETSREARDRLRARFCHQYQLTLQCLHETLMACPPQPEHLTLIEVRLGYLRAFMSSTCTPPRSQDITAPPTTTTTQSTTTVTTTPKNPSTTRPLPVRLAHKKLENNSLLKGGYTVTTGGAAVRASSTTTSTLAPPAVSPTNQAPSRLQLLFGYHGDEVNETPTRRISSRAGSADRIRQGVAQKLDCTVDKDNKIDVRCLFSGSQRHHAKHAPVLASLLLAVFATFCLRR